MERHWEADPDFLSNPCSEPDVDTYRTVLTEVLGTFLTCRNTIDGQQGSSVV